MALGRSNIMGKLDTKKSELTNTAAVSRETAKQLESKISGLLATANASDKQANAVSKALDILNEAGVVI